MAFVSEYIYGYIDNMIMESLKESLLESYLTGTNVVLPTPFYPQRTSTDKIVSKFQYTDIEKIYSEISTKKGK